jgi:hypothetical protein
MSERINPLEEEMETLRKIMESLKTDFKLALSSVEAKLEMTQASIDGMAQSLLDTWQSAINPGNVVVGLGQARSNTTELITSSMGLVEPSPPVPVIGEPLETAPVVPDDTNTIAHAFCSTEYPSRDAIDLAPAFTSAAAPTSPTTIVDVIPVLTTGGRILNGGVISDAVSLPAIYSSGSPSSEVSELVSALILPTKCSRERFSIGVIVITKGYVVVSHEADQIDVLRMFNTNCDNLGEDRQPPWPPPHVLGNMLSDELLQYDEVQWQPWSPRLEVGPQGQMFRPRPWPAFKGSWEDVQLTLSKLSVHWHPVRKVLQRSGNLGTIKANMYVWKSLQGISGAKPSTHIHESGAEYSRGYVIAETVKGFNSLHWSLFQLYSTSNALLNGSTHV